MFALRALQRGPTAHIVLKDSNEGETKNIGHVDFNSDGSRLALGTQFYLQLLARSGGTFQDIGFDETLGWGGGMQVKFNPDGDRLATIKLNRLRFWSVPDWKELRSHELEGPTFLHSHSTGGRLLTATRDDPDAVIRSWNWDGSAPEIIGRMEHFNSFAVDVSGSRLAYTRGSALNLRSLDDWSLPPRLLGNHSENIWGVVFHPSGDWLAATSRSGEVRLWSTSPGSNEPLRTFSGPKGVEKVETFDLAIDSSGSKLALLAHEDSVSTVRIWDLTGPPEAKPIVSRRDALYSQRIRFDSSGDWLVTNHVNELAFWPVDREYPRVLEAGGKVGGLAFTPDGQLISSTSGGNYVRVWPEWRSPDSGSQMIRHRIRDLPTPRLRFGFFALDPSGKRLLVNPAGRVSLLSLDGELEELFRLPPNTWLWAMAFSPKGRLAATAPHWSSSEEKVIRVWDLESREMKVLGPLEGAGEGMAGGYNSLSFLPDGRLLSSRPSGLYLWNLDDGNAEVVDKSVGTGAALSQDGRYVLRVASLMPNREDPTLNDLWWFDLKTGASRRLPSHGKKVVEVVLDPTDTLVVTGSFEGVVRVGPVTGEEPHLLYGHEGEVNGVAVSPDGRWIASGGVDGTIHLWPMPEGPPFHTLPYEEILERLRSVTNLRVVEDEDSATGYDIEVGPFPGWETLPKW